MGSDQASDKDQSGGNFRLFCICIALFFVYLFVQWIKSETHVLLERHFWTIVLSASLGALLLIFVTGCYVYNAWVKRRTLDAITENVEGSAYLGTEEKTGRSIYLRSEFRSLQGSTNGSTGSGKTVVQENLIAQDMEQHRGMIIVDGKADRSYLERLYGRAIQLGREKDFMVFSLAQPNISSTFNPFAQGTPEQVTERVFSAFNFTDAYYKSVQYSGLRTLVALLMARGQVPMPGVIRDLLMNPERLKDWTRNLSDPNLANDVSGLVSQNAQDFQKNFSGLITALGYFSQGSTAPLFNTRTPEIILSNLIRDRKICYFQLPTTGFPTLGPATGKLVLQCLQGTISELQVQGGKNPGLFPIYLDDFNDFIYPEFISILNKSRSAGIAVMFSHQSLADLKNVSPEFAQRFVDNTNIKVIMKTPDPESAEFYAKLIGTVSAEKSTTRRSQFFFGWKRNTGEESVRDVEEFEFHPNQIKTFKQGQGVLRISHPAGVTTKLVNFALPPSIAPVHLPVRDLPIVNFERESTAPDAKFKSKKGQSDKEDTQVRQVRKERKKKTAELLGEPKK